MDKTVLDRMTKLANKGLAFDKLKTKAETAISTIDEIDFNNEPSWTLAKDYSRDNILNLTSVVGLNRKSTRNLT